VAVVLGVVFATVMTPSRPSPAIQKMINEATTVDAGAPKVAVPVPDPPPAAMEDAGLAAAPSPAPVPDPDPVPTPAPNPSPAPAAQGGYGVLELDVDPNVEVAIDGKPAGRTPLKVTLPAGRKVLKLTSKDKGIDTSRVVTIKSGEKTEESIRLGKGYVQISAPEGAQVFIDDIRIGSAPIRGEVPVYEGRHNIRVNIGTSKWNENFTMKDGKRVSFQVNLQ
jgi:serine/threonine-protein kinase